MSIDGHPLGWEYPPGTWSGDPRAPWNAPEDRYCDECRFFCEVEDGDDALALCLVDAMERDTASAEPVLPEGPACEDFEESEAAKAERRRWR